MAQIDEKDMLKRAYMKISDLFFWRYFRGENTVSRCLAWSYAKVSFNCQVLYMYCRKWEWF